MIRLATKEDIKSIKTIENRCFSDFWTEKMLLESLDNGCIMVVIDLGEKIAGYAGIYPSGDITNIAVLPYPKPRYSGKAVII